MRLGLAGTEILAIGSVFRLASRPSVGDRRIEAKAPASAPRGRGREARLAPHKLVIPFSRAASSFEDVAGSLHSRRVAIVAGHEGDGLSAAALDACAFTARIPMASGVDSLNVATAAAIALYELDHV